MVEALRRQLTAQERHAYRSPLKRLRREQPTLRLNLLQEATPGLDHALDAQAPTPGLAELRVETNAAREAP